MKPDFSGEYILNRSASALSPNARAIASARMRIVHEDPRFWCSARFASDDDTVEFTFERFTDDRRSPADGQESSRCYWEGDTLVAEDRFGAGETAVVMTWRYELLGGPQHLRATERIRGGSRDQDNVWEFERQ